MKSPQSILCINSGSSSVKIAIYSVDATEQRLLLRGSVEDIGLPEGRLWIAPHAGKRRESVATFTDHSAALAALLREISMVSIDAVGHRIVSGGPTHLETCVLDASVLQDLRSNLRFAPLHLPAEIAAIDAVGVVYPGLTQIACFDTAFHRSIPEFANRLPLPRSFYNEGVRKYGFHGLSYASIVAQLNGTPGLTIIAHLGSGASMVALRDGRSIDTTMGMTPIAGLIMATRSGDLDPGVVLYLMNEHGYDARSLEQLLDTRSGLYGISDGFSDMEMLLTLRDHNASAAQAVKMFCYQARKHIGSMAASLGGLDRLIFTGGIGEHAPAIRAEITAELGFLGISIDAEANLQNSREIGTGNVRVMVIPTDEERTIARECQRILSASNEA